MNETRKPSYWAVLPAAVRYDSGLPPNAKLLYAEISALCDENGYCYAHNSYFANNFEWNEKSVTRHLKTLSDHGYVVVDVVRDPATKEVLERRIYAGINPAGRISPPSPQNCGESPQNCGDPSPQNCGIEQLNNMNNIPPKAPQGGRRSRAPKKEPDWKPERFAKFWEYYPRGEAKQAAIRAWDKLQPSDELIDTMAQALQRQVASESWQQGIGIPYASTWLNQQRWTDEKHQPSGGQPPPGHVVEEEGAYYL